MCSHDVTSQDVALWGRVIRAKSAVLCPRGRDELDLHVHVEGSRSAYRTGTSHCVAFHVTIVMILYVYLPCLHQRALNQAGISTLRIQQYYREREREF